MTITDLQREERKGYVGSSDSAALLGVSPFANATDVWLEKTGRVEKPKPETDALLYGNLIEEVLLRFAEHKIGLPVIRNVFAVADNGIMSANLDGRVDGRREAVEAKTVGLAGGAHLRASEWGEEGTDQIPAHVIVQATHQMVVDALDVVWVPVILFGAFRMYRVERCDELCDTIEQRAVQFWKNNVLADVAPEDIPQIETLKRLRREPGKIVPVDERLLSAWEAAREYRLKAEKAEEGLEAMLLHAMGDAEGTTLPDGRLLTYMETKKAGYTVQPSTYRSLRVKKQKES